MERKGAYSLAPFRESVPSSSKHPSHPKAAKEGAVNVLEEGQTIRHEQYGIGTVTESNTERTTIDFDNHGMKKFVTSIWSAEIIGEAPAERPTRRRTRKKAVKK
jgi:hypothetical protein